MENTSKGTLQIDDVSQEIRSSFTEDPLREKFRFLGARSRQISRETWLVSLFVLLQIVIFAAMMGINDCSDNSQGDCAAEFLGRFSFQPLSENPMLGPSASTLEHMGALRSNILVEHNEIWRILTSQWLHTGVFHLIINTGSLIFIGIYMEQEFGPMRIALIYILSSIAGGLCAVVFVRNTPSVCPAAALFGLIGAMLSELSRNWNLYSHKMSAILIIFTVSTINFVLGLLPYIDNFANIGGFISGFLLGFAVLFTPQVRQIPSHKTSLYDYEPKSSKRLKEKFDRPIPRIICLVLFCMIFGGFLIAALEGINLNQYCGWCHYMDCIPSRKWSCSDMTTSCEAMVSEEELTLTCMTNGKFRTFPYTNISETRTRDLCTLICS